jgi:hypothetical protein
VVTVADVAVGLQLYIKVCTSYSTREGFTL